MSNEGMIMASYTYIYTRAYKHCSFYSQRLMRIYMSYTRRMFRIVQRPRV
jgi:hypothetical protein